VFHLRTRPEGALTPLSPSPQFDTRPARSQPCSLCSRSIAEGRRGQALARFESPADEGRRDAHLRCDFAHGKPALVQFGEPVVVENQASPAADAPLAARFLESASYSLADVLVFLLGDPGGDWTISRPAHLLNRNAPRKS
jgi:hypothetical protein